MIAGPATHVDRAAILRLEHAMGVATGGVLPADRINPRSATGKIHRLIAQKRQ